MAGKGDKRRPCCISYEEWCRRHERAFGKEKYGDTESDHGAANRADLDLPVDPAR